MRNQVLTKSLWIELFKSFGIRKGSVICLQGSISRLGISVDGYQSLIDSLLEVIGTTGCILVPTFTFTCLDPACRKDSQFPYEMWKDIREEMKGFDINLSPSDVYSDLCNQFLRYPGVKRTNHPVYSFAYLGNIDNDWLKQTMNYPISFVHVLKAFTLDNSYNILLGISPEESIFISAISKTMNRGITEIQKAYIKKDKGKQAKTYLNLKVDPEYKNEILDMLNCVTMRVNGENIHCVTLNDE